MKKTLLAFFSGCIYMLSLTFFAVGIYKSCRSSYPASRQIPHDTITIHDTIKVRQLISNPKAKSQKLLFTMPLWFDLNKVDTPIIITRPPALNDSLYSRDSVAIIQKEYSDDSTYVAYISGVSFANYPQLDSLSFLRQSFITNSVNLLPQKNKKWRIGLQAGFGYGLKSNDFQPFIGIGVSFCLN